MITEISVDGFKSLSRFNLKISPGLNILVGPNGSGKTNIILFFEFLSRLTQNDIGNAVSISGGAGSLFQKTSKTTYNNTISASISGLIATPYQKLSYVYDFAIRLSDERDFLYFQHQRVRLALGNSALSKGKKWDFDVTQTTDQDLNQNVNIRKIDFRKFHTLRRTYRPRYIETRGMSRRMRDMSREEKVLLYEKIIKQNSDIYRNLVSSLYNNITHYFRRVLRDMSGGETFNIIPSSVKEPEDSATPPGIHKNGAGLAATLFALKQSGRGTQRRLRRSQFFDVFVGSKTYEQIIKYTHLVNDQITNLDVVNDPVDNNLQVNITQKKERGYVILPLSAMSDGTVKWISLITAILTYQSIFAIEEPENFIHPVMQKEFIRIMRNSTLSRQSMSFVLMTTHSETLLNVAKPGEIIVVSMSHGVTKASRPKDKKLLAKEIKRTGFGLGHYYLTGALDDA